MSKYVGETEQNMATMFREAEGENAVLLLDEVDSFLQDRRGAQRNYEVSEVNEMLQGMERHPGCSSAPPISWNVSTKRLCAGLPSRSSSCPCSLNSVSNFSCKKHVGETLHSWIHAPNMRSNSWISSVWGFCGG